MSVLALAAATSNAIAFPDLGLSPVALDLGFFQLRWYSLAYLAGIFIGYWYLLKLLKQPGAPMARRHADDLVFYASLGIIFGGRLGYVLFYNLPYYLAHPIDILKLWDGGMSFHGGVIGTSLGILYLAWKEKLQWLRIHDYVACCVPFGLFFGRLANFVNQELWGSVTTVPWAIRFEEVTPYGKILGPPRHPSQLYEAGLEGLVLGFVAVPVELAIEPCDLHLIVVHIARNARPPWAGDRMPRGNEVMDGGQRHISQAIRRCPYMRPAVP